MFALQEKVVYPGHGVAEISRIVEKVVAGKETCYYELRFLNKDMTILVPTQSVGSMPIRPISSWQHVQDALTILMQPARKLHAYEFTASSWNKRHKEYQTKLRLGGLRELSEIYRDLRCIELHKELSFGEKSLLQQAESLMAEEIALVKAIAHDEAVRHLRSLCTKPHKTVGVVHML